MSGRLPFSRADDEMHLDWLARSLDGEPLSFIAMTYRTSKGRVQGALYRIKRDDAAAHGEGAA